MMNLALDGVLQADDARGVVPLGPLVHGSSAARLKFCRRVARIFGVKL